MSFHEFERVSPETRGLPSGAVLAWLDALEADGQQLHGFTLLRAGQVLAEGWSAPYTAGQPQHLNSLSKAFAATGVGLLVHEGRLSLEDRVVDLFPDQRPAVVGEYLGALRVKDLLTMRSGRAEDSTRQLEGDWVASFLALPFEFPPGTHFVYDNAASFMLSALVQRVTGQTLLAYLTPRLFEPLGIRGVHWETNEQGQNTGGWGLHLRTGDVARFGQLLLNRGEWQGQTLLPAWWVDAMGAAHVPPGTNPGDDTSDWAQGYGYQLWRCRHGAFRGDGAHGQFCVVLPEQDVVLAVTAGVADMQRVLDHTWTHLLGALGDAPLLPSADREALLARCAALSLPLPDLLLPAPARPADALFTFDPNPENWTDAHLTVQDTQGRLEFLGPQPLTIPFDLGGWRTARLHLWDREQEVRVRAGWQADGTLALTLLLIEEGARWEVRWAAPDGSLSVQQCAPHYGEGVLLTARPVPAPVTLGA